MIRAACATALAAFGLAGCTAPVVRVTGESAAQAGGIGDTVHVEGAFCVVAGEDGGACATLDASRLPQRVRDAGGQLLAAFLVPASAVAPATATARSAGGGADVTLAPSASLAASLQAARPAPDGQRWAGFVSPALHAGDVGTASAFSVAADFGIARGAGGLPQPATFAYASMGGLRPAGDGPVDCDEPTTLCGPTSAGGTLVLRDLRGAGATVEAAPGTEVSVPFTLRYVGAPGPAFALHATTTLPGGAAATTVSDLAPDTGFVDVGVRVTVPAGAAPGEYDVVLTASTGGEERRALGTLVVTGAAAGDPSRPPARGEEEQDQAVDGAGTSSTIAAAGGVVAPAGGWRFLDYAPVARASLGPHGRTVTAGEVSCHKLVDYCWPVSAKLLLRADELGDGPPGRLVVAGRIRGAVPAQGRRSLSFTVGRRVRRLLASGATLHAIVSVRAGRGPAIVRRLLLVG